MQQQIINSIETVITSIPPYSDSESTGVVNIAFSGGMDSTVLAHVLCSRRQMLSQKGWLLRAIHVDHGIRSEDESLADLEFLSNFCVARGLPLLVFRCPKGELERWAGEAGGIEAAARMLRRRIFTDVCSSQDILVTAHHADDHREQMLMSFLQGHWESAMRGIAPVTKLGSLSLLRPFLLCNPSLGRRELRALAQEWNLHWREDPSNGDPRFRRNALRRKVMPAIRDSMGDPSSALDRMSVSYEREHIPFSDTSLAETAPKPMQLRGWQPRALLGNAAFSIEWDVLRTLSPLQRRTLFFHALMDSADIAGETRIPGAFIDKLLSCPESSELCEAGMQSPGYGIRCFDFSRNRFFLPDLAAWQKKGYFVELMPGEQARLEPINGVEVIIESPAGGDKACDHKPASRRLFAIDGRNGAFLVKSLNSQGKLEYLIQDASGGTSLVPQWMIDILPVVFREQRAIALVYPDFTIGRWELLGLESSGVNQALDGWSIETRIKYA